ncbi:MAG: SAM-dependent methyltransferase [Streptosporangiaceae bacterium]
MTAVRENEEPDGRLAGIDTSVAHPARVYDYWLGGKDNFAADREAAERVIAIRPTILRDIRSNREFLHRTVRYLAEEAGIRQFLDIGTGIPTSPNVHEIAQSVHPAARVVYVDNDPIVLVHARALLTSGPEGKTDYMDGDLRQPDDIIERAAKTLDFGEPMAVILLGVLHLISDAENPHETARTIMASVSPGSYLVVGHPASDVQSELVAESARQYNARVSTAQTRRSFAEVTRFFDDLELVEPGVVQEHRWRPGMGIDTASYETPGWGGVGRKP